MSLMFTEDAEARKTCLIPKKIAKLLVIKITLLILTLFLELWTYVALTLIQAHVACQSPCLASIRRPNDVKSSFMEVHITFHFLILEQVIFTLSVILMWYYCDTYKCCAFLLIKAAEEMKIGFVRWKSALILVAEMSQRSKMAFVLSSNVTVKRPYFSR